MPEDWADPLLPTPRVLRWQGTALTKQNNEILNDFTVTSDERHVPLLSGWVDFYTRRLYRRIEDVFNRPVKGSVGSWMDVMKREWIDDRLVPTGETVHCLNLGSYNYLGFAGNDPYCTPKARKAVEDYGVASCSPIAELGSSKVCDDLERLVCRFLAGSVLKEAAMTYGMGFATNAHTIPALFGPGDLILSDALNHTSIVEGARSSKAKVVPFKHNDPEDLEKTLHRMLTQGQPAPKKRGEPEAEPKSHRKARDVAEHFSEPRR